MHNVIKRVKSRYEKNTKINTLLPPYTMFMRALLVPVTSPSIFSDDDDEGPFMLLLLPIPSIDSNPLPDALVLLLTGVFVFSPSKDTEIAVGVWKIH